MRQLKIVGSEGDATPIGASDLCEMLGFTQQTLGTLLREGVAVKIEHGVYDRNQTVQRYIEKVRGRYQADGEERGLNLTSERARWAKEKADAEEIKNARLRGEMVLAAEVEHEWADVLRGIRARILAVPARVAQSLKLDRAQAAVVDSEVRSALSELGRGHVADDPE